MRSVPSAVMTTAARPSGSLASTALPSEARSLSSLPPGHLSAEVHSTGAGVAQLRPAAPAIATAPQPSVPLDDATPASPSSSDSASRLTAALQEKALATALHVGLRGPAARVAGAAAAVGLEGYGLYCEINEHGERLDNRSISEAQYQERVCESAVTSSGRAMGGLAGAAAGQAAIPVPIVGAVVGGVIGAACGGLHANSLARGAWRLTGGKAKGGDDLVRCIEHRPTSEAEPCAGAEARLQEPSSPAVRPPACSCEADALL